MRKTLATAAALALALGALSPAMAANARHPYRNVDKRVDKGGPTGDSEVDKLNQQQLDAARAANGPSGMPMPTPGMPARPMGQ